MSNEKETAVEWLEKNMWEHIEYKPTLEIQRIRKKIQQAKEMEKEQIVNTWSEATAPQHEIGLSDASYIIAQIKKAEQYYNETYGGNK